MKISDLVKTSVIKIPNTDIEITVKTELSWVDFLEYLKCQDQIEKGKFLITKIIVDWNIQDEEGNPLPVTADIVGKLPASVVLPLADQTSKLVEEINLKKNS